MAMTDKKLIELIERALETNDLHSLVQAWFEINDEVRIVPSPAHDVEGFKEAMRYHLAILKGDDLS